MRHCRCRGYLWSFPTTGRGFPARYFHPYCAPWPRLQGWACGARSGQEIYLIKDRDMDGTESKNPIGDQSLAEIVRRLVKAYSPERIYLFGSRSRSDSGADSDYDLIVVVPDSVPPERKRSRLAYEVLRGTGIAVDVLVWTSKAFNCRLHLRASLPYTIISEGKLLYAAWPYPIGGYPSLVE